MHSQWRLLIGLHLIMILIYNRIMIVCVCKNINSKKILEELGAGLTLEEIKMQFGMGSQCGNCLETAKKLVEKTKGEPIKNIAFG